MIQYPYQALPSIIQNAVTEYQQYGKQPIALIACSALSCVSLSCQSLANVARDSALTSPVAMYFIAIASSGERKTAADNNFSKPIRDWQSAVQIKLSPQIKHSESMKKAWSAEHDGLLAQIRKMSLDGLDTSYLKEEYAELVEDEPTIPLLPRLFFEDVTQEALAHHLANGWPSASLWSDEAGIILSGYGMQSSSAKFVAMLNRLWDGKEFFTHRKSTSSFTVHNRRLTLSLMMQPVILKQLLNKNDGISRQSGFLARCLLTYPESRMGNREYAPPPKNTTAMQHFNQRIRHCLDESLSLDQQGCHSLPLLQFDRKAKKIWVQFFNSVEQQLAKNSDWLAISDFVSKAAENAARLAALFHLFDGCEKTISPEHTEQAIEITRWHLAEVKRILGISTTTIEDDDSKRLISWIEAKGIHTTNYRNLRQFGPIRDKERLLKALNSLLSNRRITESNKDGRTEFLVLKQG